MNIHTVAVLFVIGCTPPSVFSSDVAGRHRQAVQSKKNSGGGNSDNSSLSTAIDQCIKGFTGTYTYAWDCNGVAFMASLGCDAKTRICDYSESQFAEEPSDCVLSGSFHATEHVDPRTCEVKVFKLSGENCNSQESAWGVGINRNEFNEIDIYYERMDNAPRVLLSSPKDDLNTRRLEQNFVGVLYSKSVDDHHRYLASGDITTGDKMKVLDVHRRRLQCPGDDGGTTTNGKGRRTFVTERFRGKVTGYQTLEYVQRGIPKPNETPRPDFVTNETPRPGTVINLGSTTTGVLYKIPPGDDFPPNPDVIVALPPDGKETKTITGPPVIDENLEEFGTFIVNAFHGKNFIDGKGQKNYFGDTTSAQTIITICESRPLFGGCSTFLHAGELKYPNSFIELNETLTKGLQAINDNFVPPELRQNINIFPNTLFEYPNLNPSEMDEIKYFGSAVSGTGASGFDIQRDRKGYGELRYNSFPNPADFDLDNPFEQGLYGTLSAGTAQEYADAYQTGNVTRQCRDFELYSYQLTRDDLNEFLDMASEQNKLIPAEARTNSTRDGDFNPNPIPKSKSVARDNLINKYLTARYGYVPPSATCDPATDCNCAPANGFCRNVPREGTLACFKESFRFPLYAYTCTCGDKDLGPTYKNC